VNGEQIAVDRGLAEDLVQVLSVVEDWLLHTGDDVLEDLGDFVFPGYRPTTAVTGFITALGTAGLDLHRLLTGQQPADPGQT
jgi:hypothetical protein